MARGPRQQLRRTGRTTCVQLHSGDRRPDLLSSALASTGCRLPPGGCQPSARGATGPPILLGGRENPALREERRQSRRGVVRRNWAACATGRGARCPIPVRAAVRLVERRAARSGDAGSPTYEWVRDELAEVVRRLEVGTAPRAVAHPVGTRRAAGGALPTPGRSGARLSA